MGYVSWCYLSYRYSDGIYIQGVPKKCIHILAADNSIVYFFFTDWTHWTEWWQPDLTLKKGNLFSNATGSMKTQWKCKDNLGGSLTKNYQHELLSLELEISLKLMELFRTSIRSVPEDHVHRQALERKKEYWKPLKEVQECLCGKLVVR